MSGMLHGVVWRLGSVLCKGAAIDGIAKNFWLEKLSINLPPTLIKKFYHNVMKFCPTEDTNNYNLTSKVAILGKIINVKKLSNIQYHEIINSS